jgi:hypothetical protein
MCTVHRTASSPATGIMPRPRRCALSFVGHQAAVQLGCGRSRRPGTSSASCHPYLPESCTVSAALAARSVYAIMSTSVVLRRKRDKPVNLLTSPARSSKASTPSPQATLAVASMAPQSSGASAIASLTHPNIHTLILHPSPSSPSEKASESWWSTHGAEIVAGVRHVLGMAGETVECLPFYDPAVVISMQRVLKTFQVRGSP